MIDTVRPQLLYVVRLVPYIPSSGGLTRTYHLLRAAAQVTDITLLAAVEDPTCLRLDMAQDLCTHIHTIMYKLTESRQPVGITRFLPGHVGALIRSIVTLLEPDPFIADNMDRALISQTTSELLRTHHYDIVAVDYTSLAYVLRDVVRLWGGPSLATLQDVVSVLEKRRHQTITKQRHKKFPSMGGWRSVQRLRSAERSILRSYQQTIAVSEFDAAELHQIAPRARINIAPNGVDVAYFDAVTTWPHDNLPMGSSPETIVFTGSLWYPPNMDALRFFVNDIWPHIRRQKPTACFWAVGDDPPEEVKAMGQRDGIKVFGSVPDVRPYLAGAAVAIVPLRIGSGTRLKILEALVAKRPVVSTTLGAEGLTLVIGCDIMLTDSAQDFANAVVNTMDEPDTAHQLVLFGYKTMRATYSWDKIALTFQRASLETKPNHAHRSLR